VKREIKPVFSVYNGLKRPDKGFVDFRLGTKFQSFGLRELFRGYSLFIYLGFWWIELKLIILARCRIG